MSTKEKAGTITRDPELAVLALVDRKLSALKPDARARILAWLLQKHGAQGGTVTMPSTQGAALDGTHV